MSDSIHKSAPDWEALLGCSGPLATVIPHFSERAEQQKMAVAVGSAILQRKTAVIEAGTGVGKTFAYLLPALASGGKVIISTGTKTLQDQLFFKDLPLVKQALKTSSKLALLKGRANYLCVYRMKQALFEGAFKDRRSVNYLHRIDDWSAMTQSGDIAEVNNVPPDAEVWSSVTSTLDNCLGADCDDYADCHIANARREAQEADVVVVNHHLFFADMALKEEGFGELLPHADTVILDESHQLPEIASSFFSDSLSSRQIRELSSDILVSASCHGDMPELVEATRAMDKDAQDLRLAMDKPGIRESWHKISTKPVIVSAMKKLIDTFHTLDRLLGEMKKRSKDLNVCYERLLKCQQQLENMQTPTESSIQWYETFMHSFNLVSTPLEVATDFKKQMEVFSCAWVFTSATLAVDNSFVHFNQRIGIEDAEELLLDSPFDYWHHSLMYAPPNIPEPQQYNFVEQVVEASIPVINACHGGVFVLFTSYYALNKAAELFKEELDRIIMVQGETSQQEMLEQFRQCGNAVLLGTGSFWEGVDVRGEALKCVIIDKLPFAAPTDPVTEARIQSIKNNKGNAFYDYQLPRAVIALKQGVGRLIRDGSDKGVLVICDPRLRTKSYGRVFQESLPRMPRTQKIEVVKRFFALHSAQTPTDSNNN